MTERDPDQDLLSKLDRRQRRSEILSFAPAFCVSLAAGLLTFVILKFALHWDGQSALDVAGLVGLMLVFTAYLRAEKHL